MKRIYTITFEDGEYPSNNVESNIKVLMYLLYKEIENLEYESDEILYKKGLMYNELFEIEQGKQYEYRFDSEKNICNFSMYEPFMIDKFSFGFTINDDLIDSGTVQLLLENLQKMLRTNYKFTIDNRYVYEKDRERMKILKKIQNKEEILEKENNGYTKVRVKPLLTVLSIIGR